MRKAISTALAGSGVAAAAIVAAPTASASYHTITSVVYWTGVDCITVRSPQSPNGHYTGLDRICGGNSTVTYGAGSGEYIGADPMAFDQTRTVGCQVFIDGVFSYGDYARDGDHHDVNCLRTLADDYYPNGVQGRAL
jgi:hypothetical protein